MITYFFWLWYQGKNLVQWKPLNRASVYRANRLFEHFPLKKKRSYIFSLINSLLRGAGTLLVRAVRRAAGIML